MIIIKDKNNISTLQLPQTEQNNKVTVLTFEKSLEMIWNKIFELKDKI